MKFSKIYSDDFDQSRDEMRTKKEKKFQGSIIDNPIEEDEDDEDQELHS